MDHQTEFPVEDLPQAFRALRFIQLQLIELVKDSGNNLYNGQMNRNCFVELETKLEMILHETRSVCRPPPTKPAKRDFKVIESLASGAFGTVKLVRHKETKQKFALKQIALQYPHQRDAVLLERDILTYLDHPLIVPMFCSFETASHMYMAMEYVGGGDLADLLQDERHFDVNVARFYIAELVLAVEYIHSYGILHRDLKPSNLLIGADGHIKVADFGLSKFGSDSRATYLTESDRQRNAREFTDSEICGTSVFMAPEVFLQTGYGKPVDWWATGVILYNLLYGNLPFSGWNSKETAELVAKNDVHFPDAGSPQRDVARNLISRLLEKDPVRRLGTRGAGEVKSHPFFQGVDWKKLLSVTPPYIAVAEDTSCFPTCASPDSDDDQTEPPAEETDFCTVAFRFNKAYGSPMPLSPCTPMNRVLLSEKPGHSEAKEGQQEIEAPDEGFCGSTPAPAPHHASPGQKASKYFNSDSEGEDEDEDEDVSNMHVSETSQRQGGRDESRRDSASSPAPDHVSPGQKASKYFNSDSEGEDEDEDEDVSNMHVSETSQRQGGRDESRRDSASSPAPDHVSPGQIVSKYYDSNSEGEDEDEDVSNMHVSETSQRQGGQDGSRCDSASSPAPDHVSPGQIVSKYYDSNSEGEDEDEDEDVSNMHVSETSQRQGGQDESRCDSASSPAPDHVSPGQIVSKYMDSDSEGEDEDISNMHFIEASHRQSGQGESDSASSPAPDHISPGQIVSKYVDRDSDEEDVRNTHFIEASHRKSGQDGSDSTPSPALHHTSPAQMDAVKECPSNDLLEATRSLMSVQLQLVELTKACGNTLQNNLASPNYFVELESKVVKLYQETHKACSPTVGDDSSEDSADPNVEDDSSEDSADPNVEDDSSEEEWVLNSQGRWQTTQSPVLLKVSTR